MTVTKEMLMMELKAEQEARDGFCETKREYVMWLCGLLGENMPKDIVEESEKRAYDALMLLRGDTKKYRDAAVEFRSRLSILRVIMPILKQAAEEEQKDA